jgi:hypothetical protein
MVLFCKNTNLFQENGVLFPKGIYPIYFGYIPNFGLVYIKFLFGIYPYEIKRSMAKIKSTKAKSKPITDKINRCIFAKNSTKIGGK